MIDARLYNDAAVATPFTAPSLTDSPNEPDLALAPVAHATHLQIIHGMSRSVDDTRHQLPPLRIDLSPGRPSMPPPSPQVWLSRHVLLKSQRTNSLPGLAHQAGI